MTPEEARTKWCPKGRKIRLNIFQRIIHLMTGAYIPRGAVRVECCIGPDCMAWRWYEDGSKTKPFNTGYCGAFGKDGAP